MADSKIEKALASVKGSMAVEGHFLTKEEENLIKKRLNGEISESEFEKQVLEQVNG